MERTISTVKLDRGKSHFQKQIDQLIYAYPIVIFIAIV